MSILTVTCTKKEIVVSNRVFWDTSLGNRKFLIDANSLRIKCQSSGAFNKLLKKYPELIETVFVSRFDTTDIAVSVTKWHDEHHPHGLPGSTTLATYTGGAALMKLLWGDTSWTVFDIFDCSKQVGPKDRYLARCGDRAFFKKAILIPIQRWFRSWGISDGRLATGAVDAVALLK